MCKDGKTKYCHIKILLSQIPKYKLRYVLSSKDSIKHQGYDNVAGIIGMITSKIVLYGTNKNIIVFI